MQMLRHRAGDRGVVSCRSARLVYQAVATTGYLHMTRRRARPRPRFGRRTVLSSRGRFLHIEDDRDVVDLLAMILELQGYAVTYELLTPLSRPASPAGNRAAGGA
jgi:hypothetical protein